MPEKHDSYIPPQGNKEEAAINSIPENLTGNDLLLSIDKLQNGQETGRALIGKLINGPIEVGKHIQTALGNSTEVVEIKQTGGTYLIKTKSGSEYRFDPSKSTEAPDYLKKGR